MNSKFLTALLASAAILVLNTACTGPGGRAVEDIEAAPAGASSTGTASTETGSTKSASTKTASTETSSTEGASTEAASVDAKSPPPGADDRWTAAMHIPVDGSSLKAFNESLEKIRKQARESEYTTLTNAIDYLLVYDLAAKRDRTRLAANLDGLTGAEIIDKVHWRKGR